MTTDPTNTPEPGPDAGIDEIQADIEHTRAELGETIEMLSAKADVTGRAKQKVAETTPPLGALMGAAVVLVVGVLVWRRRRRR